MNKEVFIRPAEISDAEIMAEVVAESWKIAYGNLISEDDMKLFTNLPRREDLFKNRISKGDLVSTLLLDDKIVGVCSAQRYENSDFKDTAEIDQLYLAPSAIGKGLGERILNFSLDCLIKRGFNQSVLFVMEGNVRAEGFYRHMGFIPDGLCLVCENLSRKNRALRYIKKLL